MSDISDSTEGVDDPLIGTVVADRYLVRALLGQGGMGAVYEAEHVQLRKKVALKILHSHMSSKPEVQARFEREAVAVGRLRHPGIVTATDFGRLPDDSFYLALEHVEGRSLSGVIEDEGALAPERAFSVAFQVASALEAAHAAGIVHRDLKPDNIMLTGVAGEDVVKVLDFGIAKMRAEELPESQRGLTKAGLVFGTPHYMSPEQAKGLTVDHRADLYALGMITYEMLKGVSAFVSDDLMAILTAQMTDPPPPLPSSVPEPFAKVVMLLLEKEPEDRPQTAEDVGAMLKTVADEVGWIPPEPRSRIGSRFASVEDMPGGPGSSFRSFTMRPVGVGKASVPLWIPVGALLLGLVIGGLAMLGGQEKLEQDELAATNGRDRAEEQLLVEAAEGDRDALAELRKLAEQERPKLEALKNEPKLSEREQAPGEILLEEPETHETAAVRQATRFMALARGYSVIRHHSAVLSAYDDAVKLDPHLAQEPELLSDVRHALEQRDAVEEGLVFALEGLGSHGADMIYDIWLDYRGRPGMTPVVARAMRLVKGKELRDHATPALLIAMDLERAKVCAEYELLLPRAVEHADERSLPILKALRLRRGCGLSAKKDCFPCLRDEDELLERAVQKATATPQPSFLATDESKKD